jgi:hypothetical protein
MAKDKIRDLLDFVPLIILTVSALIMLWTVSTSDIVLQNEHYVGLTLLVITSFLFIKRHKLGVLSLALILFLGFFKILSYSAVTTFHSFGGSINGHSTPEFKIQGIFILWLLIHFIVSGRHYIGIATKQYWVDLFGKSVVKSSA